MVDEQKSFVKETSDGLNAAINHTSLNASDMAACKEGVAADRTGKALQCLTNFTADKGKQEQLRETTLAKGKENAVKLISALRDAQNIADKASEIKSISAVLGVDISDYMDPSENPMDAANKMNEDRLYDMAYYGSLDTTIARWNGAPATPEKDAGAAVATNEERK